MKSAILATSTGALLIGTACNGARGAVAVSDEEPAGGPQQRAAIGGTSAATGAPIDAGSVAACGSVPEGVELWRHELGEVDVSTWTSVAADPRGDAFVSSPAGGTFKVDRAGHVAWAKQFGGIVGVGGDGHAYVAGTLSDTTKLDTCMVIATSANGAYLAEIDPDGTVLRCVSLSTSSQAGLTGIAVDDERNVVVSGPGIGTVKLDDEGHVVWTRPLFGRLAVDSRGDVVVAGSLTARAVFGEESLESEGGEDVLLAKLDARGDYVFVRRFGDSGVEQRGEGVAVDASDEIFVSGVSDGTVDFGGGPIAATPEACSSEVWCAQAGFVAKFGSAGEHVWSRSRFPVRSLPGIAVDSRGNVVASGSLPGNAPPYRLPLLVEFDESGNSVPRTIPTSSNVTDSGAGYGVAFDPCDDVLWAHAAPPVPSTKVPSFLAKLAP